MQQMYAEQTPAWAIFPNKLAVNVQKDICLVNMPFDCFTSPSIGLSILKAEAQKAGLSAVVEYGGIYLAAFMGLDRYKKLQNGASTMMLAPEMLFQPFVGYEKHKSFQEIKKYYMKKCPERKMEYAAYVDECEALQSTIDRFLDEYTEHILEYHPKIVGVTYSFQQCNAGLALLKRIKEKAPSVITVLGGSGATLNAGQALIDTMSQIDYVYTGESDDTFAEASRLMMEGRREELYERFPWILRKGGTPVTHCTEDLNQVAWPDYDDFFEALERTGLRQRIYPLLLVEGSRGCWWGCKHRCRFCGLHGSEEVLRYRKKDVRRLVQEIEYLSKRYQGKDFMFTDCILDMEHIRELPAMLEGKGYHFFAEVKSNLTLEQLHGLKKAGFLALQPGIESLQDDLLKLMNKGNRAIRHVELLKNARTAGISLAWNIIQRFPTEKVQWYEEMLDMIPLLAHLGVPNLNVLQYQRNSVFTTDHEKYGVNVRPCDFYRYLFSEDEEFIWKFAEYFEKTEEAVSEVSGTMICRETSAPYEAAIQEAVFRWRREADEHHMLTYFVQGDFMGIFDTRDCAVNRKQVLEGLEKEICLLADQAIRVSQVRQILQDRAVAAEIDQAIAALRQRKLLIQIGEEILFLAVPRNFPKVGKHLPFWIGYIDLHKEE